MRAATHLNARKMKKLIYEDQSMTKMTISLTSLEIKELEQKIAPTFYSSVLLDSLWGGVDSYTVGDNSWHWDYTEGRMDSYLGNSTGYDPMGIISGSTDPVTTSNPVVDSLWSGVDSYTVGDNSWHWDYTEGRMDSYLGNSTGYDPMGIIYGSTDPAATSNPVVDSLWGGVDSYTVGDNSWHWDYTEMRMDSYLGDSGSYDPMGIIYGGSSSVSYNPVNDYLNQWLYW